MERFKAKRYYKYNYSDTDRDVVEELVDEGSAPLVVEARSKPELDVLEALSRRENPGVNYKIPIPCLANKYYRLEDRLYCTVCFFKPWCGLVHNPKWFYRKTQYKNEILEIARHNPGIARVLGRSSLEEST